MVCVLIVLIKAGEVWAEGFEGDAGDVEFVGEESFAVVGDDEVDGGAEGEELVEEADGVDGTGGACDSYDEGFAGRGWEC